jgi:hypothetical protein
VTAGDPALGKTAVATHIPFPGRARRAGLRVGPADDPDDEIAGLERRSGWGLDHFAQALVADDQPRVTWRRFPIGARRDLPVGPADADGQTTNQHRAFGHVRLGDVVDAGTARVAWRDRHRSHRVSVATGAAGGIIRSGR